MSIRLRFAHWGHRGEVWTLDLGEKVVLRDASGATVAAFPYQEAPAYLEVPGFFAEVKYLGIRTNTGLKRFRLDKHDMHAVCVFVEYLRAKQDPEAPRKARRWAVIRMTGGLALAVVGIVSFIVAGNRGDSYDDTVVSAVLAAIVYFVYGLSTWRQAARMQRLAQEESWGPEGPTGLR